MSDPNHNKFLNLGRQYEAAAVGKDGTDSRLSPLVVYNMFSMALENYCMAILTCHGTMADNHTFTDLLESLDRVCPFDSELKRRIFDLERHQQICSFTDPIVGQVDTIINREFKDVVSKVAEIADSQCCNAE
jgi:hypothetical protein